MDSFKDMKIIYDHLEKNALDYKYPHQIAELFKKLRDLKHQEDKKDEAEKAQWEVDFFSFGLNDNKLSPKFTWTDERGEIIEYPSLNRFNERTYSYLIERLDFTHNPLIKARYSHLLWLSPKKHSKYAEMAIDSYLELIRIYEKKDKDKPEEHYGLDIINSLRNAFFIGYQIKSSKLADIKSEIIRLVKDFNLKSRSTFVLRFNLIELMLKEKKTFSRSDFIGIEKVCWEIAELAVEKGNTDGAIKQLELGEKIDSRLNQKSKEWRKRIAELYETLVKQTEEGNNLAALSFCQQALENYKIIKDTKKISEIEKKYDDLRESMKLKEFKQKIDLSEHIKRCREIATKLAKEEPEKIVKKLIVWKQLLPKYKDMQKIAEDIGEKHPVHKIFSKVVMDQRGHTAQHFTEEDEEKYYGILEQYNMDLQINKIPLIREIFFSVLRNKKLTTKVLLEFMVKNSWYGKNITKKLGEGREITYSWINLLAPSIHEYFKEMERFFLELNNRPNLVLAIDSLTLKIEGLLRDMCEFSGVSTFYQTKDKKGRNITREKDLHALLHNEKIKELFDEDDLLFFRFLLVEQAGLNLRHRVAHSLLYFQEYSVDLMNLLILALLRIGKYDFVKKGQNKQKKRSSN
jgi:hypothetical protein